MGLGASGWANSYYSAAVEAGAHSWKAFFFGSVDVGGERHLCLFAVVGPACRCHPDGLRARHRSRRRVRLHPPAAACSLRGRPVHGKGATIAIVLDGHLPSMQSDADQFFAAHGLAGFAPGQYQENYGPGFADSCGSDAEVPEEPLDVETAHIIAPDAKVVDVGVNCSDDEPVFEQNFLDAETRIVDQHLADVETNSDSTVE